METFRKFQPDKHLSGKTRGLGSYFNLSVSHLTPIHRVWGRRVVSCFLV